MIAVLALLTGAAAGALVDRFECARCHELAQAKPVPLEKQCAGCHRAIARGELPKQLDRWNERITSLRAPIALDGAAKRFRRSWLRAFLLKPYDLRPGLPAMMPRLAITPKEAESIAAELGAANDERPHPKYDAASIARGRELAIALECVACHGAEDVPDLRVARERLRPGLVRSIVRDPRATMPSAKMPAYEVAEQDAIALEAWVIAGELPARTAREVPERLPLLERRVAFSEVDALVFRRTCWHCHSDPDLARGDGGPGNTGGFGFAPRGLSFAGYADAGAGSFGEDGERKSVFPFLVDALIARQIEESGGEVPGVRGMPLGLPALSAEQVQLVESWIAQGRPR